MKNNNLIRKYPYPFKKIFSVSNDVDYQKFKQHKIFSNEFMKRGLHISTSFWINDFNNDNSELLALFNINEKGKYFDELINDYHNGFIDHIHNYSQDYLAIIEYTRNGKELILKKKLKLQITNDLCDILNYGNNILHINNIKLNSAHSQLDNLNIVFFAKEIVKTINIVIKKNDNDLIYTEGICYLLDNTENFENEFIKLNNIKEYSVEISQHLELFKKYKYYYKIKYYNIDIKLDQIQNITFVDNSNNILIEKLIISELSFKRQEKELTYINNLNINTNYCSKHSGRIEDYFNSKGFMLNQLIFKDISELIKNKLNIKCCWSDPAYPPFPFSTSTELNNWYNYPRADKNQYYLTLNNINLKEKENDTYIISRNSFYPLCNDKQFCKLYYLLKNTDQKSNELISEEEYNELIIYICNKFNMNYNEVSNVLPLKKYMGFSQGNMLPFYIFYSLKNNLDTEYLWYTHFGTMNENDIDNFKQQLDNLRNNFYGINIDKNLLVMSPASFINYKIMYYNIERILNKRESYWFDSKNDNIYYDKNQWYINIKYLNTSNWSSILNYLTLYCDKSETFRLFINTKEYFNFTRNISDNTSNPSITIIDNTSGISLLNNNKINGKKNSIVTFKPCPIQIFNVSNIRLKYCSKNINFRIKIHSENNIFEIISSKNIKNTENNYFYIEKYSNTINDIYIPFHNIKYDKSPNYINGTIDLIEIIFLDSGCIDIYNLELYTNNPNCPVNDTLIFSGIINNMDSIKYDELILWDNTGNRKILTLANNENKFLCKSTRGNDISIIMLNKKEEYLLHSFKILKNITNFYINLHKNFI